ncbi:toll/interleukin-1 receptor domain-containing protein, partial [Flavobacteriaceae bacterium]|nr:toll/interleukin-1 receptor domain-containing protein [Flavobacteriaceae bacterium]
YDNILGVDIYLTLHNADNDKIQEIASEYDLERSASFLKSYPTNWVENKDLKCFISHATENKEVANLLKEELSSHKIDCFVAHEDIKPSKKWQKEIEKALSSMDLFISIHTEYFNQSNWCQQEVGFALASKTEIIPIKSSKNKIDPTAFLGEIQAFTWRDNTKIIDDIISYIRDSSLGEKYEKINPGPVEIDDEIPF